LSAALATGREPAEIDWFPLEDRWAHQHDSCPVMTSGDIHKLARQVRDTWPPIPTR
jgi:hypothetical protein